jgi:hypothetical protein
MNIAEYNEVLVQYNAAWKVVCDLRRRVQDTDTFMSAYGVRHHQSELQFQINPRAHVEALGWPTVEEILKAVALLVQIGEQVVSAYNHLTKEDRYLVKLPELRGVISA